MKHPQSTRILGEIFIMLNNFQTKKNRFVGGMKYRTTILRNMHPKGQDIWKCHH